MNTNTTDLRLNDVATIDGDEVNFKPGWSSNGNPLAIFGIINEIEAAGVDPRDVTAIIGKFDSDTADNEGKMPVELYVIATTDVQLDTPLVKIENPFAEGAARPETVRLGDVAKLNGETDKGTLAAGWTILSDQDPLILLRIYDSVAKAGVDPHSVKQVFGRGKELGGQGDPFELEAIFVSTDNPLTEDSVLTKVKER